MTIPTGDIKESVQKTLLHLEQELSAIRTGRANPNLIEHLPVNSYGGVSPLQQLAAISVPEPQLLVVQPWDPGLVKDIEKALSQSSLGISPVVDGKVIRLPWPAMTEERRLELLKLVKEKGEQAKVSVRIAREEAVKKLKLVERDGTMSEDAVELALKHIQTQVDGASRDIEERLKQKGEEVQTI